MNRQDFLILLSRRLTDGLTAAEENAFIEAVRSNEGYAKLAREISGYFDSPASQDLSAAAKLSELWKEIENRKEAGRLAISEKKKLPKGNTFPLLRFAALILLVLSAGLVTYYFVASRERFTEMESMNDKLFAALPDGTQVSLNRRSSISYNTAFGVSSRIIKLKGEAFFDVAANAKVPLFIHTGNIIIEVKGTAFNVNAYEEAGKIEIALIRGSVEVSSNTDKDRKVTLKPDEKVLVTRSAAATDFEIVPIQKDQVPEEIRWAQDSLVFRRQKLKDLALGMEKKYKVRIEIRNEALKHKRFSGSFKAASVKDVLEVLKVAYPFNYRITGQKVIIE